VLYTYTAVAVFAKVVVAVMFASSSYSSIAWGEHPLHHPSIFGRHRRRRPWSGGNAGQGGPAMVL